MPKAIHPGRLSLRVEGDEWVAYFAPLHTMEGAHRLGSLRMSIARVPEHKAAFMELMKAALDTIAKEVFGEDFRWGDPVRAPEAERSGRG